MNILAVGKAIRKRRKGLGLTTEEAAKMAGISRAHWVKIESGDRLPSLETLDNIAYALQVTAAELLSDRE